MINNNMHRVFHAYFHQSFHFLYLVVGIWLIGMQEKRNTIYTNFVCVQIAF